MLWLPFSCCSAGVYGSYSAGCPLKVFGPVRLRIDDMVIIIEGHIAHEYSALLDEMFRLRARVFADRGLGGRSPSREGHA